jgi:hypothetical protein
MVHAMLVREMKWTWQEYQDQPTWLIHELIAYMSAESQHRKSQSKQ